MDVEVQADTARVLQRLDLSNKTAVLRCVSRSLALVCLGARVGAGTVGELPLVRPVTVDVSTNAAASADGLAVLAPESVGCLTVDETVRVDYRHDVEVELVNNGLNVCIRGVLREQLPREVLRGHSGDPFASVDGAVNEHCGL